MSEHAELLDAVVAEVVEQMFFSVAEPSSEEAGMGEALTAAVWFSGTCSGALCISMPAAAAAALASSYLGTGEPVAEAQARSTLGELANVLCGAVLGRAWPLGAFRISPPGIFTGAASAEAILSMNERRSYQLEEGPLALGFSAS